MAWPLLAKLVVGLAGSWFGIKQAELHHLKDKFEGLLHGWKAEYKHSTCQACLDAGEDFCISSNKCIKRATFHCKGPYDHITGDKEFSLHGNPEGVVHSMTCPADKNDVDKKDCFFDKECHDKVNWAEIKKIKMGFFGRLKFFKEKNNEQGVHQMMEKVHVMFKKAGMPEDRIDYILEKWVKVVYPEALEKKSGVDTKDCYFDKECHAKVDWKMIGNIKKGFFARLKYFKEKDDKGGVQNMLKNVHAKFKKAGMPEDRIDYILDKWVKNVFPEALDNDDKSKDCYFDKECHAKVDWDKIKSIKMGFFKRLKMLKTENDFTPTDAAVEVKKMMVAVHKMFLDAGMPDDRIDYILTKWVKFVYPEALGGDAPKPKPKWDGDNHPMCKRAKMRCMKDGEKVLEGRCMWLWKKCGHELGMDTDDATKPKMDMCKLAEMKCMKDGEKVLEGRCMFLWKKCGMEGSDGWKPKPKPKFNMCEVGKKRCMKDGEKVLEGRCAWVWKKCGGEIGVLV